MIDAFFLPIKSRACGSDNVGVPDWVHKQRLQHRHQRVVQLHQWRLAATPCSQKKKTHVNLTIIVMHTCEVADVVSMRASDSGKWSCCCQFWPHAYFVNVGAFMCVCMWMEHAMTSRRQSDMREGLLHYSHGRGLCNCLRLKSVCVLLIPAKDLLRISKMTFRVCSGAFTKSTASAAPFDVDELDESVVDDLDESVDEEAAADDPAGGTASLNASAIAERKGDAEPAGAGDKGPVMRCM